jgi:ribosomal protein L7/L12
VSIGAVIAVAIVFLFLMAWFRTRAGGGDPLDVDLDRATESDLRTLLMAGRKIDAIKVYRQLHNVDLKAAKEAVERLAAELPPSIR